MPTAQLFRNAFINLYTRLNRRRILRKAYHKALESASSPSSEVLARSLNAVIEDGFSEEETLVFQEIEGLRSSLLRRRDRIPYGMSDGGEPIQLPVAWLAKSSKSPTWARILYSLIRYSGATKCLELGTNMGISAAYQAAALRMNGGGRLWTLEGNASSVDMARSNLAELGFLNVEFRLGQFGVTLHDVLERMGEVHYAFIDGHHERQPTLDYFEAILPYVSHPGLIVFDDISWSSGMREAWREVCRKDIVQQACDLYVMGLVIVEDKRA